MEIEFSEEMAVSTLRLSSVPTASFTLASWVPESRRAVFSPSSLLNQDQQYAITVEGTDAAGNSLAGNQGFAFTTVGPTPDTTPPTLVSSSPSYAAFGISRDAKIKLTFSEPMDRASVERAFRITFPAGTSIGAITWNSSGTEVEFSPEALFPYNTDVVWYLSAEATDLAGGALSESSGEFHTVRLTSGAISLDLESSLASTEPILTANPWPIGDDTFNRPIHGFASFRFAAPSIGTPLLLGYQDLEVTSGIASIPVTAMVVDAWNHRATRYERAQFRLKFESWSDDDNSRDFLQIDRNHLFLKVTFESP